MTTDNNRGIVVVTGASTGIGRACALHLDKLGFDVFAGVRRAEDADALTASASPRLSPIIIDVTDAATIQSASTAVASAAGAGPDAGGPDGVGPDAGGIRALVNNAGVGFGGPLEFIPLDDLRRQLEVNVVGQVAVSQAFLPLLRSARGRLVLIGSIGGKLAAPFMAPYAASKFALEAIADALRLELRQWGIEVALVEPGSIDTAIWDKANATIAQIDRDFTPEARALYGEAFGAATDFINSSASRGIPPDRVAKAVAHAITSKRPKTRYIVGNDARMQSLLVRIVPDRIRDSLIARQIGLPK
jgi:NAD(P)-dependent dehydrogenase (short-subunit alcohol dehydrogenase family)